MFGGGAVRDPASKKIVDTLEMKLVERIEFRGVALSGLDEKTLVGHYGRGLAWCRVSDSHHDSGYSNCEEAKKLRRQRWGSSPEPSDTSELLLLLTERTIMVFSACAGRSFAFPRWPRRWVAQAMR